MNYKVIIFFIFSFLLLPSYALKSNYGLDGYQENRIDAIKNARLHSNTGNIYFEEKQYIAALKEYEIAYNLTSKTNSCAVYLYNIARCYIAINNYLLAKNALLGAIHKDCMNITYYETLVDCYIELNIEDAELKNCINDNTNPYNRIIAGLIYLKTGRIQSAKMIFDEFITNNPDMLITSDIKTLLKRL